MSGPPSYPVPPPMSWGRKAWKPPTDIVPPHRLRPEFLFYAIGALLIVVGIYMEVWG